MKNKIKDILNIHDTLPILFVGAGLSRRYLGLENWEGLLRYLAQRISDNEFGFEMYNSMAESSTIQVGLYQKIAELIGNDFSKKWFIDDKFKEVREEYRDDIKNKVSPIKIEISKYIKDNSLNFVEDQKSELELLKKVGKKSIAGVITTNYDLLLENILPGYKAYVGQEELIFSQLQGVGEIYKIHGCCTNPSSIVINEEDYKEFDDKNAYLASKILTLFLEHPIVFMGYSIEDENIRNILKSIVRCLSKENLKKLKKRLIFIEWSSNDESEISSHTLSFDDGKVIEMTKIKLNSFEVLYEAMLENKAKYSAPILRKLKQDIYELVLTNEPTEKMKVVGLTEDDKLEDVEVVVGVGILSELGKKGYETFSAEEIYNDIVFNHKDINPQMIVETSLPNLLKQHSKSIPIYKYIKEFKGDLPSIVNQSIKTEFDDFLNKTLKERRQSLNLGEFTIKDLRKKYDDMRCLEYIPLLNKDKIDIEELSEFLQYILREYPNLLSTEGKQSDRTNLKRLIRIYDWIKYYK